MTEGTERKEKQEEKALEKMTVKELREIAKEIPHAKAVHDMKKEELVAFIREARGIKDEAPAKKKKKNVRLKMTKAELKAEIRELKKLKLEAEESGESQSARELRERIVKLKKKSRRLAA